MQENSSNLNNDQPRSEPVSFQNDVISEFSRVRLNMLQTSLIDESNTFLNDIFEVENNFCEILEKMNAGLLVHTEQDDVIYTNRKFKEMIGEQHGGVEGNSITKFLDSESLNIWQEQSFKRHRMDQSPYEIGWIGNSGNTLFTTVAPQPLFNSAGKYIGGYVVCVDITKRKWLEEVLRKSEEKYRDFVENIDEIIFGLDAKGEFTFVSPVIETLLSQKQSDVIGKSILSFVFHADLHIAREMLDNISDGLKQSSEYRVFTRDCKTKWVRTSCRPIFQNNNVIGVKGVIIDITQRKNAEAALRKNENRYRNLVETNADAILVIFEDSIVYANKSAVKLLGAASQQSLLHTALGSLVHSESEIVFRETILDTLSTDTTASAQEIILQQFNGSRVYAEITVAPFIYNSKRAVQVTIRNLKSRKDKEENRLLEETLQLRREKINSLTAMAGGIAHDFNNLLTAILGNASLARLNVPVDSSVYNSLVQIEKAADDAAALTKKMLNYSGKGHFITRYLDLNEIIDSIGDEIVELTDGRIFVSFQLSRSIPKIKIDRNQVSQAVKNLMLNAVEAIEDGGRILIRTDIITVNRDSEKVMHSTTDLELGMYVVLEISDNGCGIPEKNMRYVYDPFFTTKFTGRGLGLASVQGIMRGHNGAISLESRVGHGTTAKLFFRT